MSSQNDPPKQHQRPPLSSTSFHFPGIASNECWKLKFFEILPDVLTGCFCHDYLFSHINHPQMVLIKLAEC